jgi:hypothetical protein
MTEKYFYPIHLADFQLRLFRIIGDMHKNIASSLNKLAKSFPESINKLSKTELALEAFYLTPLYIMPKKPYFNKVFNYHSAFIVYHWDAKNLISHSIISCLSSIYGAAYSELRMALESILNGAIYDCLAHSAFRENVNILTSIKGFQGAKSFKDLIKILENLDTEREKDFEISVSILDIIVDNQIIPEASPSRLINQLKDWEILNKDEANSLHEVLKKLSSYVHRTIPSYSDVGIRLERGMNWLSSECVHGEIINFMDCLITIAKICASLSLNIIGKSSLKYKEHLIKGRINELIRIYQELGDIDMQNKIVKNV